MKNQSVNARKLNKNIIVFIAFATVLIVLAGLIVGLGVDNSRAYAYADSTEYISNSSDGQGGAGQDNAADSTQNDATTAASSAPAGYESGTAITGSRNITSAGRYYLANDVNLTTEMQISASSGTVYLHLNGHTLKQTGTGKRVIFVPASSNCDIVLEDLEDNSGVITGGNVSGAHLGGGDGGGISFQSNSSKTFTINGGTITGNKTSAWGGAIFSHSGTFRINGGVICNNFANGNGGAVYFYGVGYITGGKFYGNQGYNGGVAYINSTCTISGGEYYNNTAYYGNGGAINFGNTTDPVITGNVNIHDNTATEYGGGVYCRYKATISGSVKIHNNTSANNGGGAYFNTGVSNITGATITNNTATNGSGGGVFIASANSATVSNLIVSGNKAGERAGGLYFNAAGTVSNSTISANTAVGEGGGMYFLGTGTVKDTSILKNTSTSDGSDGGGGGVYFNAANSSVSGGEVSGNSAKIGGGLCFYSQGSASNVTISNNEAFGQGGGGIWFRDTNSSITGCTVTNNSAYSSGGGVSFGGVGTSTNSIVSGNTAGVKGGGLFLSSNGSSINGGSITDNTAAAEGGGVFFVNAGTVTGVTISNNTSGKDGGGIYFRAAGTVSNATISGNKANFGGGVYFNAAATLSGVINIDWNVAEFSAGGIYAKTALSLSGVTELNVRNNTAETGYGGGIFYFNLAGSAETFGAVMTVTGNKATKGGGIYIEANKAVAFNMTGGTIAHNAAQEGGGVYLAGNKNSTCAFNMTGGDISNNGAEYGGGVYLNCNTMTFADGSITNNVATYNGAGVYLASVKAVLIINNAAPSISGNLIGATWAQKTIVPDNPDENPVPDEGSNEAVTTAESADKGYREVFASGGEDESFGVYSEGIVAGRIEFSVALDTSIHFGVSINTGDDNLYASVVKIYASNIELSTDSFSYAGEGTTTVSNALDGGIYIGGIVNAQVEFGGEVKKFPALDLAVEYAGTLESTKDNCAVVRMLGNAKFWNNTHMVIPVGKFVSVLMEGFSIDAAFNPDTAVQGGIFYVLGAFSIKNGSIIGNSAPDSAQEGAFIYVLGDGENQTKIGFQSLTVENVEVSGFVRKYVDYVEQYGNTWSLICTIYPGGSHDNYDLTIKDCKFLDNKVINIVHGQYTLMTSITGCEFNSICKNAVSMIGLDRVNTDAGNTIISNCTFRNAEEKSIACYCMGEVRIADCDFDLGGIHYYGDYVIEKGPTDYFEMKNCTFDGTDYKFQPEGYSRKFIGMIEIFSGGDIIIDGLALKNLDTPFVGSGFMMNSRGYLIVSGWHPYSESRIVSLNNISITDCSFADAAYPAPVYLSGFSYDNVEISNVLIENCQFGAESDNNYNNYAIEVSNAKSLKISGVEFRNNSLSALVDRSGNHNAVFLIGCQSTEVKNIKVYNNSGTGSFVAMRLDNRSSSISVDNFEMHDNVLSDGISIFSYTSMNAGKSMSIANVDVRDNHAGGGFGLVDRMLMYWEVCTRFKNVTYHNVVIEDNTAEKLFCDPVSSNYSYGVLPLLGEKLQLSGNCRVINNILAGEEHNLFGIDFYRFEAQDYSLRSVINVSELADESIMGVGFYKYVKNSPTKSVSFLPTAYIFAQSATTDTLEAGHFYADDPNAMIYQDGINVGIKAYSKTAVYAQVEYGDVTRYYGGVSAAVTHASILGGSEDNMPIVRLRRDNEISGPIGIARDSYVTIELDGFDITRNLYRDTPDGYVFRVQGYLKIHDSKGVGTISGGKNSQFGGGFIVLKNGKLYLEDVSVVDNSAESGGGIYVSASGYAYLKGTTVKNNICDTMGAGIFVAPGGELDVYGGVIRQNVATQSGGGIYASALSFVNLYDDTQILLNSALQGGGAYVSNDAEFNVYNATVMQNEASQGGGMYVLGGINIDGYAFISGNTDSRGSQANNIYLTNGSVINVNGEIAVGSSIGVTSANKPVFAQDILVAELGGSAGANGITIADGLFTSDVNKYGAISTGSQVMLSVSGIILTGVSAELNLNGEKIYNVDSLDKLRDYLSVNLIYSDGHSEVVGKYDYKLLCETNPDGFVIGNNSIVVLYNGCTTKFVVNVFEFVVVRIEAEYDQGSRKIFTNEDASLLDHMFGDELKITGFTSAGGSTPITDFTLSLKEGSSFKSGTNVIVVTYGKLTAEFTIVCDALYLTDIFVSAPTQLFEGATFGELKQSISVTGFYNDGTPFMETIEFNIVLMNADGSTTNLLGDSVLAVGENRFKLSTTTGTEDGVAIEYEFVVNVVKVRITSIDVTFDQGETVIYTSQDISADALKAKLGSLITAISGVKNNGETVDSIAEYTLSVDRLVVGQNYVTVTVEDATYQIMVVVTAVEINSLTVKFDDGGNTIYTSATLDSLKQYLTVTGNFNDGTEGGTVADYTLSFAEGVKALAEGNNTITLKSGSLSATFEVNAVAVEAVGYQAEFVQGETVIFTSDDVNGEKLRNLIKIKVAYNDGTSEYIDNFRLEGTLTAGTISIKAVLLSNEEVTVSGIVVTAVTLAEIFATFKPIDFTVFTSTVLDDIKQFITLEGINNDGSEFVGDLSEFAIAFAEGDAFVAGDNTINITVSANGTNILNEVTGSVVISAEEVKLASIGAEFAQNDIQLYLSCLAEELFEKLNGAITLTGTNNDGSIISITENYAISYKFGTPIVGQNILVITYEGFTTEIVALFKAVAQTGIEAMFDAGENAIFTSHTADKLLPYVKVKGINNDGTKFDILEGIKIEITTELVAGENTVKVLANGFECDLVITNVIAVELTGIRVEFVQGDLTIYRSASVADADLKALLGEHLTVMGIYNDGIERELATDSYTLARDGDEWLETSMISVTSVENGEFAHNISVTTTAVALGSLEITFRTDTDAFFVEGFELSQLLGAISGTAIKYLTVVAVYNDGTQTTVTVTADMLALLGVDEGGVVVPDAYNVIQVSYAEEGKGELTGTFEVFINSVKLDTLEVAFDSTNIKIFTSTPIASLKDILAPGLTVTGTYNNDPEHPVMITEYNVSLAESGATSLPEGNIKVNISYGGQFKEIEITVVKVELESIDAVFNADGKVFYTSNNLDDVKSFVSVSGLNNDGTPYVGLLEYALSADGCLDDQGFFNAGTATVKATINGTAIFAEFELDIVQVVPERLEVTYTSTDTVFEGTSVEDLLSNFTVVGYNNDGTMFTSDISRVALTNGELTVVAGENEFTITYGALTTTFNLNVEAIVVVSITADFTQGETKTFTSDDMASLKNRIADILKVNALYNNGSIVENISDYELSIKLGDALQAGQNIITVTYEGATCDIIVFVDTVVLAQIEVTYEQPEDVTVYTSTDINSLTGITIVGIKNDGNRFDITEGYALSLDTETLQAGNNTVTVSYNGFEATFDVVATQVVAVSIRAEFNQTANPTDRVFNTDEVNGEKLRAMTNVYVTYNDGTEVLSEDYKLDGILEEGMNVSLTVTYTLDDTIACIIESVYVTAVDLERITAEFSNPEGTIIYTSTTLDELKQYIKVTGYNNDGSVYGGQILDFTLSLPEGTTEFIDGANTIKVSYSKNSELALVADITVEMVGVTAVEVETVFEQGDVKIYVSMDMDAVKKALAECLTVNIRYNDGTVVEGTDDYKLVLSSGENLVVGQNRINVVSGEISKGISIIAFAVEMIGIGADLIENYEVFVSTQMNDLKNKFTVYGLNNDGTRTEPITDYIISIEGGIQEGSNQVKLSYFSFSCVKEVNATAVELVELSVEITDNVTIFTSTTAFMLKQYIRVTGIYNDGSKKLIDEFSVSFEAGVDRLAEGDNNIIVFVGEVQQTIVVKAVMPELISIEAEFANVDVYAGATPTSIQGYVTVYGIYADGSRMPIEGPYELGIVGEGNTLAEGKNTINVTVGGKTTTVEVKALEVVLASIAAEFEQGDIVVKAGISAAELKELISGCLTIKGLNNDGSTFDGDMTGYELEFKYSENAIVGVNFVTVKFGGFTSDIRVVAEGNVFTTLSAEFEQPNDAIYTSANLDTLRPYLTAKIDGEVITEYSLAFGVDQTSFVAGPNTVYVKYGEAQAVINVTVTAVELESISVSNTPTKTQYVAFDTFDTSGMVIVANYNDGTSRAITDYSIVYTSNKGHLCFGDSAVTIKYNDKTTTVAVSVGKKLIAAPQVTGEYVYNGATKNAEIAMAEFYTLSGVLSAKDAGTYTIKATLTDDNYGWMGSTNNAIDILWTIDKAIYDINGVRFDGQEVVEDGQAHSIAIVGTLPTGVSVSYDGNGKSVAGIYTVTAKFTGNANYEPIEDMEALLVIKTKQMSGDNIIIDNIENGMNPDYKLEVKDITDEELGNVDKTPIESTQEIKQRFDVVLTVDGEIVQPTGKVQVKLLIDEALRTQDNLKVYCISNTGALVDVNATRDGNYMVFEADNLSKYVIVGDVTASIGEIPEAIIIGTLAGGGALVLLLMITLILVAKKKRKASEGK